MTPGAERYELLERRIRDKNFELTGVHEALRKETVRAERLKKAAVMAREFLPLIRTAHHREQLRLALRAALEDE